MTPILYLDRLQAAMRAALLLIEPTDLTVGWVPTDLDRDAVAPGLATLQLIGGPAWSGARPWRGASRALTDVRLACTATEGRRIRVGCTGAWWAVDVGPGDNASDVSAALAAELATEGRSLYATITDEGGSVRLEADHLWSLYGLGVSGPVSVAELATEPAEAQTYDAALRVRLNVAHRSRFPMDGAHAIMSRILGSLTRGDVHELLDQYGVTLLQQPTDPTDLTALSGPMFESRVASTLSLGMRSYVAQAIEAIETVELTTTLRGDASGDVTGTITAEGA